MTRPTAIRIAATAIAVSATAVVFWVTSDHARHYGPFQCGCGGHVDPGQGLEPVYGRTVTVPFPTFAPLPLYGSQGTAVNPPLQIPPPPGAPPAHEVGVPSGLALRP